MAWDDKANPQSGIMVYFDRTDNTVKAEKWVSGVFDSEIFDVADVYNAEAYIEAHFKDTSGDGTYELRVYYDDVFVATVNVSDVEIVGNTNHGGFGFSDGGFREDDDNYATNKGTDYDRFLAGDC